MTEGSETYQPPIGLAEIRAAATALQSVTSNTPLLESTEANAVLGGRLLLKAECLQETGAFKIRGAYWRIHQMTDAERARGAITYSSGNHALGVARAAQLLDSSALIVMPSNAIRAKVAAVEALGAEVTTYDRDTESYDDVVSALRHRTGRIHVPPSANVLVLAGSGTVALEIFAEASARGVSIDAILTPCGGGGLTASTAIVANNVSGQTQVYAVEPDQFDDTLRSLKAGEPIANPPGRHTICDSIMTPKPNGVTFPINQALLAGALIATDDEVRHAMRFIHSYYDLVVEPGAAVGVAAVLANRIDISGKTIATIVSGGNIDPERFEQLTRTRKAPR